MPKTASKTSKLLSSLRSWAKKAASSGLLSLFLELEPAPASRPRVGRFGVYYGKTYEKFRKDALPLAEALKAAQVSGPVFAIVESIHTKPKTGKLEYPRADVDNLAKGPLDVLTKAKKVWLDDNQIVGLLVFKRYAEPGETAGVRVDWFEVI